MKDNFGTEITKDKTVIWANRVGSSLWLSKGTVLEAGETMIKVLRQEPQPARVILLTNKAKVAVLCQA
jgi:hypothetical protein